MKRPLVIALMFYVLGVLFAYFAQQEMLLFLCSIAVLSIVFFLVQDDKGVFAFFLFSLLGFFLCTTSLQVKNSQFMGQGEMAQMQGVVVDVSYTKAQNQKIVLKTSNIQSANYQTNETMQIQAILTKEEKVLLGEKLVLEGQILGLDFQRNPGAYNEFQYLHTRNIQYKTFPIILEKNGVVTSPVLFIMSFRLKVADVLDKTLPEKEAGLMKAIVIGDKSQLDETTVSLYRKAGIYHILAVSGLHVSVLAGFVNGLCLLFRLPKKVAAFITMVFLLFYLVFTGAGVSTVRAVIMSYFVLGAVFLRRKPDLFTSISASAFLLLLYEPMVLFDLGFLYSFAAVYGLCFLTPIFERFLKHLVLKFPTLHTVYAFPLVQTYLAASLAVFTATWPITAWFFFDVSLVSILLNVFLLPTVFLVVVCGFLTSVLGMFSIGLATFFAGTAYVMLQVYEWACKVCLMLPFANVLTGRPSFTLILLYYALCVTIVVAFLQLGKFRRMWLRVAYGLVALMVGFCGFSLVFTKPFAVTMLDVSQGDATVFSMGKKAFIIDGGGLPNKPIGKNTGVLTLIPHLNYLGIQKAETAFVTHMDSDHLLGILELVSEKRVKTVVLPNVPMKGQLYEELQETTAKNNVLLVTMEEGQSILFFNHVRVSCLHPPNGFENSDNNQSLVLSIQYENHSLLFAGDLEADMEYELQKANANLSANVLKLSHHGSKTSSSTAFLKAVSPQLAIVGVGKNNSYGHPADIVKTRLLELNIPLITTADSGAILLKFYKNRWQIQTMKGNERNE